MGGVVIVSVHRAGGNHADGRVRLLALHGARLHAAGLGAQQEIVRNVEGVLHITGRMILGQIQRFKVKVVVVNFRAFDYVEAHMHEDLFVGQRDGMQMPARRFASG